MKNYARNVTIMLALIEKKDPATYVHSKRVAEIVLHLAREMKIKNSRKLRIIKLGALLHDIGKIFIPDEILLEKGALSHSNFNVIKLHPIIGKEIISTLLDNQEIENIVFQHQESFDGSGYPMQIRDADICIGAKICSVADAFETIRSGRTYCRKKSLKRSLAEMERCSGTKFDPDVVSALKRCSKELNKRLCII